MRVKFKDNLGSKDAGGLDVAQCCKGMELDVSDTDGQRLIAKGLAAAVDVPAKPDIGEAKAPRGSVERATEDLKEYKARESRKPSATPVTPETIGKNPHNPAK